MGYWAQTEEGASFARDSEMLWGDAPADVFDAAIDNIIKIFERDVDRKPTKKEVVAGLQFSLSIYDENMEKAL